MRLLTQPLFRYESTDPKVVDGALFGFVTSAGTDPEVIILLEAREGQAGPEWRYAVCRFSDLDLYVKHKEVEIWTSIRGGENDLLHNELPLKACGDCRQSVPRYCVRKPVHPPGRRNRDLGTFNGER